MDERVAAEGPQVSTPLPCLCPFLPFYLPSFFTFSSPLTSPSLPPQPPTCGAPHKLQTSIAGTGPLAYQQPPFCHASRPCGAQTIGFCP